MVNNILLDSENKIIAADERPYIERATINKGKVYFQDFGSPKEITISAASDGDTNFYAIEPVTTFTNWCGFENGGSDNGTLVFTGDDCTLIVSFTISYGSTNEKDQICFKGMTSSGSELFRIYDTTVKANGINTLSFTGIFDFVTDDEITVQVANLTDVHNIKIYTYSIMAYG